MAWNKLLPAGTSSMADSDDAIRANWSALETSLGTNIGNEIIYQPVGMVIDYAGSVEPSGWFLCNGGTKSRTTYAPLFSIISTTYGTGDGASTFHLPDFRGVFIRGAGTHGVLTKASGGNYSGVLGQSQNDKMQGHSHTRTVFAYGGASPLALSGANSSDYNSEVGVPSTSGTNGTPRVGEETNPVNYALNKLIKW